MAKKATDFLKALDERHPHMTLEIELGDETRELVFRNFLRLDDQEQKDVADAMNILSLLTLGGEEDSEDEETSAKFQAIFDEVISEDEKDENFTRIYVERIVRALRAAADDKELYEEFIEGAREQYSSDFKQFVIAIYNGYQEETRLGEAESSQDS